MKKLVLLCALACAPGLAGAASVVNLPGIDGAVWEDWPFSAYEMTVYDTSGLKHPISEIRVYGPSVGDTISFWAPRYSPAELRADSTLWDHAASTGYGALQGCDLTFNLCDQPRLVSLTSAAMLAAINDSDGIFLIGASASGGRQGPHLDYGLEFISPVPLPAAAWLFGAGVLGLIGMKRLA